MNNFELRYIHPIWLNKETVEKIEKNDTPIEVTFSDSGYLTAHTVAFIRIKENQDAYVGVKLFTTPQERPYIIKSDGSRFDLKEITSYTDNDKWWIPANSWNNTTKEYNSQIFNRMGLVKLVIDNTQVFLTNDTVNFTYDDLLFILNDFKGELWKLLLDNKSLTSLYVNHNVPFFTENRGFSDIESFLNHLDKLINNPEKKVIKIIEKKQINLARVTKETLKEYLINKCRKYFSSKGFEESFDTSPNRYLHFCLERTIFILTIANRLSIEQYSSILELLKNEETKRNEFLRKGYRKVRKDVLKNQIAMVKQSYKDLEEKLSEDYFYSGSSVSQEIIFSLNRMTNQKGCYFFKLHSNAPYDIEYNYPKSWWWIELPYRWYKVLGSNPSQSITFIVKGDIRWRIYTARSGFNIPICEVSNISNISIDCSNINKLETKLDSDLYVEEGAEDKKIRKKEIDISDNKLNSIEKDIIFNEKEKSKISQLLTKAKKIDREFDKKKIGFQSDFPHSVIFSANTLYKKTYNSFKKYTQELGLNEKTIKQLQQIEEIGLIKINEIYEFWCLLKIIGVLKKLRFNPEDNWQQKILTTILKKGKNSELTIKFNHSDPVLSKIELLLYYQETLKNRRRPDFSIHLISDEAYTKPEKLILDSKFRGNVYAEEIYKDVEEMYSGRNYSENNKNRVFVLHTSRAAMIHENRESNAALSPLQWGMTADYGGDNDHKKGHIFLHTSSVDNLQRLLGLYILEHCIIEYNRAEERVSNVSNLLCIGCGSQDFEIEYKTTEGEHDSYLIKCKSCGLLMKKTQCFCCGKPIFKIGTYWTYHLTKAGKISNVICPSCKSYFD
ncbi:nuclease domain-containing protein [Succinivibrio sp.]|uniref:nuclease domain-containing protein n=1 Tax=Succinivibrio sp. TaxID=2053619 RepID=UPI00258F15F4|nr:nuclease domain-containing protein [Succinivibrio sp.]MDD6205896.1 nuclease domain-containing protein [Succinivibrio sp.]